MSMRVGDFRHGRKNADYRAKYLENVFGSGPRFTVVMTPHHGVQLHRGLNTPLHGSAERLLFGSSHLLKDAENGALAITRSGLYQISVTATLGPRQVNQVAPSTKRKRRFELPTRMFAAERVDEAPVESPSGATDIPVSPRRVETADQVRRHRSTTELLLILNEQPLVRVPLTDGHAVIQRNLLLESGNVIDVHVFLGDAERMGDVSLRIDPLAHVGLAEESLSEDSSSESDEETEDAAWAKAAQTDSDAEE